MNGRHALRPTKVEKMTDEEMEQELREMVLNEGLSTNILPPKDASYPVVTVEFVNRHMEYLRSHPKVDAKHYLRNLRTMIKKR